MTSDCIYDILISCFQARRWAGLGIGGGSRKAFAYEFLESAGPRKGPIVSWILLFEECLS